MPIRNSRLSSTAVITEIDSGDPTTGTSQGGAARKWSGYIRAAMPSAKEISSTNTLRESSIREAIIWRSDEHTSELQSLMRSSYAVFCLKKQVTHTNIILHPLL